MRAAKQALQHHHHMRIAGRPRRVENHQGSAVFTEWLAAKPVITRGTEGGCKEHDGVHTSRSLG